MDNPVHKKALTARTSEYNVSPFILGRWSPRAMTGEGISDDELMALFDAARWAPSAYNEQPWRFIYAKRETEHWDALFGALGKWNQQWCANADALVIIASTTQYKKNDKPNPTYAFDTGAAWMALALQGASMGLVVHGMSGIDFDEASKVANLPEGHAVMAMCAIGHLADVSVLPEDMRDGETPSDRNPLSENVFEGKML